MTLVRRRPLARASRAALTRYRRAITSKPSPGRTVWITARTTVRPALAARERPERAPSGDPVRVEPAGSLESLQRGGRRRVEPTVELRGGQSEAPEAELERRDVPADPAADERTLAQQRLSERAELAAREVADLPRRPDPVSPLEADERTAGHRPGDAVDLALVEAVRAQRDLERGNLGALRGDRRPGDREGGGNRDDDHDDSTHGTAVLRPRASGSCRSRRGYTSRPLLSPVAQLAEHPAVNRRVVGSSPTRGAATPVYARNAKGARVERPSWYPFGTRTRRSCGGPGASS